MPSAGTIQRHPDGPCPAAPDWEPESAAERWIYDPANKLIEDAYKADHRKSKGRVLVGSQFLYGGSPNYGITLPRGPDGEEDRSAGAFLGELRGIARQLAPDIIDFEERAIYEIKTPASGTRDWDNSRTTTTSPTPSRSSTAASPGTGRPPRPGTRSTSWGRWRAAPTA